MSKIYNARICIMIKPLKLIFTLYDRLGIISAFKKKCREGKKVMDI